MAMRSSSSTLVGTAGSLSLAVSASVKAVPGATFIKLISSARASSKSCLRCCSSDTASINARW